MDRRLGTLGDSRREAAFFEELGQNQRLMIYDTRISTGPRRRLAFANLHDYAQVIFDGNLVGTLDRRLGQREIDLPACENDARLEVIVKAMGHIHPTGATESDRKGIYGDVKLDSETLTDWAMRPVPLADAWITKLTN